MIYIFEIAGTGMFRAVGATSLEDAWNEVDKRLYIFVQSMPFERFNCAFSIGQLSQRLTPITH